MPEAHSYEDGLCLPMALILLLIWFLIIPPSNCTEREALATSESEDGLLDHPDLDIFDDTSAPVLRG